MQQLYAEDLRCTFQLLWTQMW